MRQPTHIAATPQFPPLPRLIRRFGGKIPNVSAGFATAVRLWEMAGEIRLPNTGRRKSSTKCRQRRPDTPDDRYLAIANGQGLSQKRASRAVTIIRTTSGERRSDAESWFTRNHLQSQLVNTSRGYVDRTIPAP